MLVQAILYKEELIKKQIESECDNYFMFYHSGPFPRFEFELETTACWKVQMVSIDKNKNIIGYVSCSVDRDTKVADCFGIVNFTKKLNLTFSKDLMEFLKYLRDIFHASKFNFSAFVGGPPEIMYQKFIRRYGGRVVGTYVDDVRLKDGNMYDSRAFEIMKKDMKF